ncbi:MAG: hypothetical protein ABIG37_02245 [Nanoarchaeota archaeon]|nr:hypothetical protein [Nanoarchaeota archaeon]
MIGSIDRDRDINLFLETDEIDKSLNEKVKGIMIKWHAPKQQGIVTFKSVYIIF